ncbi:DUF3526 domain-containing protein [Singulisphaera sp. Ch08]|uniref:DUF3526 domain-containing protein n=1 Tax=Singulisphaera sp. Ch08 TaxID=3120278 RepID=A0AAU7C813_9BACT
MRHEVRLLAVDRTLLAVAILLAVVVGYGVFNGVTWAAFQRATLEAADREESARFNDLETRLGSPGAGPGVPADHVGLSLGARYAAMPPGPLASLVIGQSDLYPYYALVTTANRQSALAHDEIENPTHLMSGRFDLGFVVVVLYPLVILALGYNLLSGEKEQGTLVIVLSQPVGRGTLVLGKVLARGLAVVGLAVAISLGGYLLAGGPTTGDGLIRLALWLAVVVAYGAFWFALAVAINALGRSSATNALALAGTWFLLVAVVPAMASLLVRVTYPVPSRIELIQAVREASDQAKADGPKLNARFLEAHPELARGQAEASEFAIQSLAVQEASEAGAAAVLNRFETQLGHQQRLVDRLRFLSPAIATLEALQDVAGTGSARYTHFAAQVDQFHGGWRDYFRPKILAGDLIRRDDLARIPTFSFREEPLGAVAARASIGLAGLLLPTLVVGSLGLTAMRRYPVVG